MKFIYPNSPVENGPFYQGEGRGGERRGAEAIKKKRRKEQVGAEIEEFVDALFYFIFSPNIHLLFAFTFSVLSTDLPFPVE